MLRFIVLGQVPGTHFQLTFTQIILLLGIFYAALYTYHAHNTRKKTA